MGWDEICVLRPPLPFILSPRRGNHNWPVLVLRLGVRQIPARGFSWRRRTMLLLLGEKAGMREVVNQRRTGRTRRAGRTGLSRQSDLSRRSPTKAETAADQRIPQFEIRNSKLSWLFSCIQFGMDDRGKWRLNSPVIDLRHFINLRLHGGFIIRVIELTDVPIIDAIGREAIA